MKRCIALLILLATGGLGVGGCSTDRHRPPAAPALSLDDPALRRGQIAFYQHCHMCHPHGGTGLGPGIVNKPLPGVLMKLQIRTGLGAMPAFPSERLPDQELDALVEYLNALQANHPNPAAVRL